MFHLSENLPVLFDGDRAVTGVVNAWIRLEAGQKHPLPFRGRITTESDHTAWLFEDETASVRVILHAGGDDAVRTAGLIVDAALVRDMSLVHHYPSLNARCAVGLDIAPPNEKTAMFSSSIGNYWTLPSTPKTLGDIPDGTQTLLWQPQSGDYYYAAALVGDDYKAVMAGGNAEKLNDLSIEPSGNIAVLYLTTGVAGLTTCQSPALIIAAGAKPFALPQATLESGFKLIGKPYLSKEERGYPEVFKYLGWCSWDAFHMYVSHDKMMAKAEEFRTKDLPVRWMLFDDMWAEVKGNDSPRGMHSRTLYAFEADPVRFPQGLKGAIADLKNTYGMKIGMWHPTTGYWSGIDPEGPIAAELGNNLIFTGSGRLMPDLKDGKAIAFYDAFHRFLKDCGTDFVKIDNQSYLRQWLRHMMPIGQAAYALHQAIEDTVDKYYDGALINCMGMATENFWNRPRSVVSRCSDDFHPEDRAWFRKHIMQCSYNSYTQGCLYVADWDMWWTDDSQSSKNSVLRAMSGGPVYISDKLGRSVGEVIMPIVLADGRILRCDQATVPTADCLLVDHEVSGRPFKVWNRIGNCGVLAPFNLDGEEKAVSGTVSTDDLPFADAEEYVLWDWHARRATRLKKGEKHPITLDGYDDFCLYLVLPIKNGFAPIGLLEKYMAPAAVEALTNTTFRLKEGGLLGFVSDNPPKAVVVDGKPVSFTASDGYYTAVCGEPSNPVTVSVEY